MNCKEGDLAVIVRSTAGNEGRIVRCVRLLGTLPSNCIFSGPRWKIEGTVRDNHGFPISHIADCALKPLRDNEGEDEMLRIVGKPLRSHIE